MAQEVLVTEVKGKKVTPFWHKVINLKQGEVRPSVRERVQIEDDMAARHPGFNVSVSIFDYKPFGAPKTNDAAELVA